MDVGLHQITCETDAMWKWYGIRGSNGIKADAETENSAGSVPTQEWKLLRPASPQPYHHHNTPAAKHATEQGVG